MLNTKKRSICLILSLVMVLAFVMTASAAWDGTTAADPVWNETEGYYEISTPAQLAGMREWINSEKNFRAMYRLTADIDLGGNEWTPVGTSSSIHFGGIFEGDGHTVGNFKITSDANRTLSYIGLFGYSYGEIRNVGVSGFIVDVKDSRVATDIGGLLGYNNGGIIENCFAAGTVSVHTSRAVDVLAGGLAGYNDNGNISKSFAAVEISVSGKGYVYGGAFVCFNNNLGTISGSYATGGVTVQTLGSVLNYANASGFVASNNNGSDIKDCYATGNVVLLPCVSTTSYVAGFVGYVAAGSSVASSYSYGAVSVDSSGANKYWGGFVGRNINGTFLVSCDWYSAAPGTQVIVGIGNDNANEEANVVSMDNMSSTTSKAAFEVQGWDFDDVWCYTTLDNEEKPALRAFFGEVDENGVASEISASSISFSPAPVVIDGAGTYTVDVYAGGYEIDSITIDVSGLAAGVTAVVTDGQIVVTVSDGAGEAIDCTLGVIVTIGGVAQETKVLSAKSASVYDPGSSTPDVDPTRRSGGSSGCNAGLGAAFALLGLALIQKKRS